MAAITTTLLTLLKAGDHLICQDCLYGGTLDLLANDLPALGIEHTLVDPGKPETWEQALRPGTKAFYVETITNPLVQVMDLEAVVEFCRAHNLVSIIDNTFASPVNFRPAENGFDLSIHSCTKYLNGHSDIVAGAVIGSSETIGRITRKMNHLGGSLDVHACFLLHRGIKTLALRMERHNQNALEMARFLEGNPAVAKVNYPGLESTPDFAPASKLLDGFSGMLSFELKGGVEAAEKFMAAVTIPFIAPSLGGVETLLTRPATTSHSGMNPDQRRAAGISDGLIRVSMGIEDIHDLMEDFDQALK